MTLLYIALELIVSCLLIAFITMSVLFFFDKYASKSTKERVYFKFYSYDKQVKIYINILKKYQNREHLETWESLLIVAIKTTKDYKKARLGTQQFAKRYLIENRLSSYING